MKKIITLFVAMFLSATFSYAQHSSSSIAVVGYYGMSFDDTFYKSSAINTNLSMTGGAIYGAGIQKQFIPGVSSELLYLHQEGTINYSFNNQANSFVHKNNYLLKSFNRYLINSNKIDLSIGVMLGVNFVDPVEGSSREQQVFINELYNDNGWFAWGGKAAIDYKFSEKLAIRGQAMVVSSVGLFDEDFLHSDNDSDDNDNDMEDKLSGNAEVSRKSTYQLNVTGSLIYYIR